MIHLDYEKSIKTLKLESDVFKDDINLPVKYSCEGKNVNPGIWIKNLPEVSLTLALILEDLDAPVKPWVHWLVWNMPLTHHIAENTTRGTFGINDFNMKKYCGPCHTVGLHHFVLKVFAIDAQLTISTDSNAYDLNKAISGHVLAYGELEFTYGKPLMNLNQKVHQAYTMIQAQQ